MRKLLSCISLLGLLVYSPLNTQWVVCAPFCCVMLFILCSNAVEHLMMTILVEICSVKLESEWLLISVTEH
jgi:hypothetical protein